MTLCYVYSFRQPVGSCSSLNLNINTSHNTHAHTHTHTHIHNQYGIKQLRVPMKADKPTQVKTGYEVSVKSVSGTLSFDVSSESHYVSI